MIEPEKISPESFVKKLKEESSSGFFVLQSEPEGPIDFSGKFFVTEAGVITIEFLFNPVTAFFREGEKVKVLITMEEFLFEISQAKPSICEWLLFNIKNF
jgi:hypothetical protein